MKLFTFKSEDTLDRVFEVGILLKALDGLLETFGGILLLLIKPALISNIAVALTQYELREDPRDFIATHVLHSAQYLTSAALLFAALYLLAHGLAKIVLVVEILRGHLWAYIGLIVLTAGFIVYQVYRISFDHSISLTLLTIFDCVVVYLTVREYKRQRLRLSP